MCAYLIDTKIHNVRQLSTLQIDMAMRKWHRSSPARNSYNLNWDYLVRSSTNPFESVWFYKNSKITCNLIEMLWYNPKSWISRYVGVQTSNIKIHEGLKWSWYTDGTTIIHETIYYPHYGREATPSYLESCDNRWCCGCSTPGVHTLKLFLRTLTNTLPYMDT